MRIGQVDVDLHNNMPKKHNMSPIKENTTYEAFALSVVQLYYTLSTYFVK